jgi:hypothetical protein
VPPLAAPPSKPIVRKLQDIFILGFVLALCIFADSELAERFARPAIELGADWTITFLKQWGEGLANSKLSATTVVMITDEDAPDMADQWPLPPGAYRRFLQRAACLGASKVFLDIGLPREMRGADDPPPDSCISPLDQDHMPVARQAFCKDVREFRGKIINLGNRDVPKDCPTRLKPESEPMTVLLSEQYDKGLRDLDGPAGSPRYVSAFVGDDNLYVAVSAPDPDQHVGLPTAAFMLAPPKCKHCPEAFEIRDTTTTPDFQKRFSPPQWDEPGCIYRGQPPRRQLRPIMAAAYNHIVHGPRRDWQKCPPVLTVSWQQVFDPRHDEDVATAFGGRRVLLSAAVSGVSDNAQTELHRDLPGVYLHALATESLAELGDESAQPAEWYAGLLRFLLGRGPARPAESHARLLLFLAGSVLVLVLRLLLKWARPSPSCKEKSRDNEWSVWPPMAVMIPLACVYWLLQWKFSLAARDLLFFVVCNSRHLWFIDPTQVFAKIIGVFRVRLQEG